MNGSKAPDAQRNRRAKRLQGTEAENIKKHGLRYKSKERHTPKRRDMPLIFICTPYAEGARRGMNYKPSSSQSKPPMRALSPSTTSLLMVIEPSSRVQALSTITSISGLIYFFMFFLFFDFVHYAYFTKYFLPLCSSKPRVFLFTFTPCRV